MTLTPEISALVDELERRAKAAAYQREKRGGIINSVDALALTTWIRSLEK